AGQQLAIRMEEKVYSLKDTVFAVIDAQGTVTLENDFKSASSEMKVDGTKKVELGKIPGPGLFVIRASTASQRASAVLFVSPPSNNNAVQLTVVTGAIKTQSPDQLVGKLIKGMTHERLTAAAKAELKGWLKANVGSLGTTTTLCIVCFCP